MKTLRLIFTDLDGSKYYSDDRGDIVELVAGQPHLVTLECEDNIRLILRQQAAWDAQQQSPRATRRAT